MKNIFVLSFLIATACLFSCEDEKLEKDISSELVGQYGHPLSDYSVEITSQDVNSHTISNQLGAPALVTKPIAFNINSRTILGDTSVWLSDKGADLFFTKGRFAGLRVHLFGNILAKNSSSGISGLAGTYKVGTGDASIVVTKIEHNRISLANVNPSAPVLDAPLNVTLSGFFILGDSSRFSSASDSLMFTKGPKTGIRVHSTKSTRVFVGIKQ